MGCVGYGVWLGYGMSRKRPAGRQGRVGPIPPALSPSAHEMSTIVGWSSRCTPRPCPPTGSRVLPKHTLPTAQPSADAQASSHGLCRVRLCRARYRGWVWSKPSLGTLPCLIRRAARESSCSSATYPILPILHHPLISSPRRTGRNGADATDLGATVHALPSLRRAGQYRGQCRAGWVAREAAGRRQGRPQGWRRGWRGERRGERRREMRRDRRRRDRGGGASQAEGPKPLKRSQFTTRHLYLMKEDQ